MNICIYGASLAFLTRTFSLCTIQGNGSLSTVTADCWLQEILNVEKSHFPTDDPGGPASSFSAASFGVVSTTMLRQSNITERVNSFELTTHTCSSWQTCFSLCSPAVNPETTPRRSGRNCEISFQRAGTAAEAESSITIFAAASVGRFTARHRIGIEKFHIRNILYIEMRFFPGKGYSFCGGGIWMD